MFNFHIKSIFLMMYHHIIAWLFHQKSGIAVAGTSGKTTVTGLIGHIFHHNQLDPTVINGGIMENYVIPIPEEI